MSISASDVIYLLRSLAQMRGEISAAQEAIRVMSDQLETWRTWHDDIEQELVSSLSGEKPAVVGKERKPKGDLRTA